ncbi:hypothetical protein RB2150_17952 [Rhodobacterales bacterium HTCC2150]|nr:hypothetical protein RB2150_17952 [Rhodobacterales bacterium HTCC2150] [Rhodobacteraceae bacterium HTCC2150]
MLQSRRTAAWGLTRCAQPSLDFLTWLQSNSQKHVANHSQNAVDAFEKHAEFEADNRNEASSNYVPIRSEINQRMRDRFLIGNEQFVAEV